MEMKKYHSENAVKIENTFISLLSEKKFTEIKISHITKKAGVNRTSFYVLWSNKEELLEYICAHFLANYTDNMFAHFMEKNEQKKRKLLQDAFNNLSENEVFIKGIWSVTDAPFSPYLKMQEAMEKTVYRSISILYPEEKKESNKVLYSKFFAACAMTTIRWWLDHGEDRNFEYIMAVIQVSSRGFIDLLKL